MKSLVQFGDFYLDARGLEIALDEFKQFKIGERYSEEHKWEIFQDLNLELQEMDISQSNITDIVEILRRENPKEGSFCYWGELKAFEQYAERDPEEAAEKLNALKESENDLALKIQEFRNAVNENSDEDYRINAPGTAYVLASFDIEEFVPYKAEAYTKFVSWFSNQYDISGEVSEKLADYYKLCESVRDFADFEDLLSAQDMIYSITNYNKLENRIPLLYLWQVSKNWQEFSADTDLFLEEIQNLPESYLNSKQESYSEDEDNINEIRYRVLKKISKSDSISEDDLEEIKDKVNSKSNTNVTQSFNNFRILGQLYIDFFGNLKKTGNNGVWNYIADKMKKELDFSVRKPHIVDFSGAQNQMDNEPWIALYPEEYDSHRKAPQFFLQIKAEEIRYGLSKGDKFSEDIESDYNYIKEKNQVSFSDVMAKYDEIIPVFRNIRDKRNNSKGDTNSDNYFWVTANPSQWEVSSIEDGGEIFYTAYNKKGNKRRVFDAFEKASPGDKVIFYQSTPVKEIVAEGEITEGLHKESTEGFDEPVEGVSMSYVREVRGINWKDVSSVPDLEQSDPISNKAQGSIFELSEEEYETVLALEEIPQTESNKKLLEKLVEEPDISVELPEDLYFEIDDELEAEINASLNSGKNIIFTGPPGTGKTKLAKHITKQVSGELNENKYEELDEVKGSIFTTATADWTAFDTIGGYMPSQGDGEELEFKPGQFLKCFREESGEVTNKWLVIDEINRSDIDKAFGQLFSVLSGDSVELPYERSENIRIKSLDDSEKQDLEEIAENKDIYPVTDSWRLIATMNTYDKTSLYDMSYAFMRRFNFIHVGVPKIGSEDGYNYDLLNPEEEENYASVWDAGDALSGDDLYQDLTILWAEVNNQRDIGPSIIKDIIEFIDAHSGETDTALAQAVNSLILPQFEGLRREKQKQFTQTLKDRSEAEEDSISIDASLVEEKAVNMFSISLDDE